jgi:single-strand DNA-binding protein
MAWNETKLTVVGWINSDITIRRLPDGVVMATFLLAANERRFDREKKDWVSAGTLQLRVKCFRKLAEKTTTTLAKGDAVVVTGRVYTSRYEIDGRTQSSLELDATAIGPDLSLCNVAIDRTPVLVEAAA